MNEIGTTQVSYIVSVKTNFNPKLSATSVVLRIPTPLNTTIVDCKVQNGKAKYVPAENVIVWKCVKLFCDCFFFVQYSARIPRIQGGQECTLSGTAQLTATTHRQAWARPPIDVDFQVLMFTASGLLVRFLKVFEKNNYHSIKWVRYLTKASGGYQIRVSSALQCIRALSDPARLVLIGSCMYSIPYLSALFEDLILDTSCCMYVGWINLALRYTQREEDRVQFNNVIM